EVWPAAPPPRRRARRRDSSVLHRQVPPAELVRPLLQRLTEHARHHAEPVQERGRKQPQRREIPRHHRANEGESPPPRAHRGELRQFPRELPLVHRRDVATEAHQVARISRAAYAPSVPCRWGRVWKSPSVVSRAAGTAPAPAPAPLPAAGARAKSVCRASTSGTMTPS